MVKIQTRLEILITEFKYRIFSQSSKIKIKWNSNDIGTQHSLQKIHDFLKLMIYPLFQILIILKVEMNVHKNSVFPLKSVHILLYKTIECIFPSLTFPAPNHCFVIATFFSLISQLHIYVYACIYRYTHICIYIHLYINTHLFFIVF